MPKNKKPAGGRPAKNFDPRYASAAKRHPGESSRGTAGSRSPKHRGYRPEQEGAGRPKRRWNSDDRRDRDQRGRSEVDRSARGRSDRWEHGDRAERADRGPWHGGDDRRTARRDDHRPSYRDERPGRNRGDRPAYRDDRARRDGGDRRSPYSNDRRSSYSDERRASFHDRGDRPRYGHDDRRPSFRDERPRRDRDDRPRYGRDDRRPSFRDDRPRHDRDDRPRHGRDDRRPSFRDERPRQDRGEHRGYDRPRHDDRRRSFDRAAQGPRDHGFTGHDHRAPEHHTPRPEHVDVVFEKLQAEAVTADAGAAESFGDLGLGQNIVRVLGDMGAQHPFAIQAATIPAILDGRDVLGRGRTGSGKTIAFAAPVVEALLRARAGEPREYGRAPQALILAPTRELALQIDRTVQPIARSVGLFTTQIYGGVPKGRQVGALNRGVDIVIGTAGRIEDLHEQGVLDLSHVKIAVLDEADHMCELGFLEPMQRILRLVADGAQKLLFSATLDREVATLVDEFLVNPAVYEVEGEDQASGTIDHRVLIVDRHDKADVLLSLVQREHRTLVFTRTRAYAEMLTEQFEDAGVAAVALHGDLNQARRSRNLQKLTSGRVNVLVATDVAARGIHVDDIDLVVQADAADEHKTYLHRSGRTGRAGASGTVVTLIPRSRRRRMQELLERAEIQAPFVEVRPGDDVLEELTGRQVDPTAADR